MRLESAPEYEAKKSSDLSLPEISQINFLLIQEIKNHMIESSGINEETIEEIFSIPDFVDSRMKDKSKDPLKFEIDGISYLVKVNGYLGEGYIAHVLDLKREVSQTKLTLDTFYKRQEDEMEFIEGVAFLREGVDGKDISTYEDFDLLSDKFPEFPFLNELDIAT